MRTFSIIYLFPVNVLLASAVILYPDPRCEEQTSLLPDPEIPCCGRDVYGVEGSAMPWYALLKTTFRLTGNSLSMFSCGGSLINRRYVLTAAHCLTKPDATLVGVNITFAVLDESCTLKNETSINTDCVVNILMDAEDVVVHPLFNDEKLLHDIGLIRLQDYERTLYITPVCLPNFNVDRVHLADLQLVVAAWTRHGPYAEDTKEVLPVYLVSHPKCHLSYPFLRRSHLCAAGDTGVDTMQGDSGGPLMVDLEGTYYAIGVVSGRRNFDKDISTPMPSLYTNVYRYISFIKRNMY